VEENLFVFSFRRDEAEALIILPSSSFAFHCYAALIFNNIPAAELNGVAYFVQSLRDVLAMLCAQRLQR